MAGMQAQSAHLCQYAAEARLPRTVHNLDSAVRRMSIFMFHGRALERPRWGRISAAASLSQRSRVVAEVQDRCADVLRDI